VKRSLILEIVKGPGKGKVFSRTIESGQKVTMGRQQPVDVRLVKPSVSRLHCTLSNRDGEIELEDHAMNPTLLNGERIYAKTAVAGGDILKIGEFHLQLEIHERTSLLSGKLTGEALLLEMLSAAPGWPGADSTVIFGPGGTPLKPSNLVGKMFGPYLILQAIGKGGTAEVFRACRVHDNVTFAVKVFRGNPRRVPQQVQRFHRETRLLMQLAHPNITRIIEGGERYGALYIICEYLRGRTLKSLLKWQPRLSIQVALTIAYQLADGLSHAAEHGIIHRDVNPANLLVQTREDKIQVKLIDFGLGKQIGDVGITAFGEGFGTPGYMAPEQLEGACQADLRSDIHGVGAVLYHMLSGRPPREAATVADFIEEMRRSIPSLAEAMPDCPLALVQLVDRCLEIEPAQRFQNYGELLRSLARIPRTLAGA